MIPTSNAGESRSPTCILHEERLQNRRGLSSMELAKLSTLSTINRSNSQLTYWHVSGTYVFTVRAEMGGSISSQAAKNGHQSFTPFSTCQSGHQILTLYLQLVPWASHENIYTGIYYIPGIYIPVYNRCPNGSNVHVRMCMCACMTVGRICSPKRGRSQLVQPTASSARCP